VAPSDPWTAGAPSPWSILIEAAHEPSYSPLSRTTYGFLKAAA
jgi:hypothetical protein